MNVGLSEVAQILSVALIRALPVQISFPSSMESLSIGSPIIKEPSFGGRVELHETSPSEIKASEAFSPQINRNAASPSDKQK